jgi:predicted secreted acid phosphatase
MSGKEVRESVGLLLVVASLVFVGMQIRQSTMVARAQSRQFLTENHREWAYTLATNPELSDLFNEAWNPNDGRTTEQRQASYLMFALMRHLENVFLQVSEGVIDESAFQSYAWTDLTYFDSEKFDAWWASNSGRFDESFREAFETEYGLASAP